MSVSQKDFNITIDIWMSNSSSLKELAELSRYDKFEFYRGASLLNLDLSKQDLSGMNFEGADLTGSDLSGIKYDVGAFNGCRLSPSFDYLKDDFDCYIDDLLNPPMVVIHIFVKFRGESLENILNQMMINYTYLSKITNISTQTIRRARRSEVVSLDTAVSLCTAIIEALGGVHGEVDLDKMALLCKQPLIEFLTTHPNGGFRKVDRGELIRLFDIIDRMRWRYDQASDGSYVYKWRDAPDSLRWLSTLDFGDDY